MNLLPLLVNHSVRIERPKMSVFKLLLSYSDIEERTINFIHDDKINFDDLVEAMLDQKAPDDEIIALINQAPLKWNLKTILSLVIMKQRYFLTQRLIDRFKLGYKSLYVKIGIEFD